MPIDHVLDAGIHAETSFTLSLPLSQLVVKKETPRSGKHQSQSRDLSVPNLATQLRSFNTDGEPCSGDRADTNRRRRCIGTYCGGKRYAVNAR